MPFTSGEARGTPGGRRQSKSVTLTYGTVSAVLLLVIAAVALIVQPPSPPALAEFAPQPDKTIDEGPDNQSSQFGTGGAGACSAGQVGCEGVGRTTTTLPEDDGGPSQPVIDKARVRRCVGDPPRQIEDPQSPPCAPYWEGPDNGGATSRGVTRDEIRVVYSPGTNDYHPEVDEYQALADFFNRRFELYGRHIRLVAGRGVASDPSSGGSAEGHRRAADHAAEQQAFAHLTGAPGGAGSARTLRERLAHHRIVSVVPDDDFTSEAELQALHPYAWSYNLSFDRLARDLAEFACASLVGGNADHAGTGTQEKPRSFAVLVGRDKAPEGPMDDGGDPAPLIEGLRACRAPVEVWEYEHGTAEARAAQRRLMSELRNRGVTTVIPLAVHITGTGEPMEAAAAEQYEPEWLLLGGGSTLLFSELYHQNRAPAQTAHLFGLSGWNKTLPQPDRASTWAFQEEGLALWETHLIEADIKYRSLLLLASGIQAAGPRLTPETFAKGLQSLRFPNPGAGAAPYYQATVGFTGDHTMVDDEALVHWSATAPAYYSSRSNVGGWCWIGRGTRWRTGQWPRLTFPFFDPSTPCR